MHGTKTKSILLIVIFLGITASAAFDSGYSRELQTEEIVVRLDIPRLLQKDIFVQYDGTDIYISIFDLFSLLDINIEADFTHGVFSGEYLHPGYKYEINLPRYKAKCGERELVVDSSFYIATPTNLYLKPDFYDSLFGIKMFFNFSDLSVYMPLQEDFPAYQKLKRKKAHQQLKESRVALRDVHEIQRGREYLAGGVADWTLTTSPLGGGAHYLSLGLGGMLLGGDMAISGTGNSQTGLNADDVRYKWHYVLEDNEYITQAEFGDIVSGGYLSRSLKGFMVTNQPVVRRKIFQTVSISDRIEPGWEVELYVNNRLADFTQSDAGGEFHFFTDIEYGRTKITLKMYGPSGELREEERLITVPFNLIPKNKIEYTLAAGTTESYNIPKKYTQFNGYYGLLSNLTAGVSADIPIADKEGEKATGAMEMTYQPLGNLMLNGTFCPDYASEFSLNFRNMSIASIYASYAKYYENEFLNRLDQIDGLSLIITSPFKIGRRHLGLRFRYSLDKFPTYRVNSMNFGFKFQALKSHINYIGNYNTTEYQYRTDKKFTSKIIFSSSLLNIIRPQVIATYDHQAGRMSRAGLYLHKRIFRKGQISLSVERNFTSHVNTIMLTFNIATPVADFTSRFIHSREQVGLTQTQKGSIRFNQETKSFRFVRRNGVGSGSAVVWPFLDENYNGILDDGELLLPELKATIGGTASLKKRKDKVAFYDNLRAYDEYLVEIDPYSLDNPMLTPAHENYKVTLYPNTITEINVPIVTAGEVSGRVDRKIMDGTVGVGGIKIFIVNEVTGKEIEMTTFNSGDFFYLGLVPGMYRAYIDPEQLENYGYVSKPAYSRFQIKTVEGGDYVGNVNFVIDATDTSN